MTRPAMRTRTLRVDDKTWGAAMETAEERNETLSEEVRKFLQRYAKKGNK